MCMGNSYKHEIFKDSKATLYKKTFLDKEERRAGGVLDFRSENALHSDS